MISNTDIRYFFDTYYDNFMHSLAWEDYLLEPASREEWLATLRACADDQQQRCADNQILLEQYLYPLSSNPALLSDEGYDLLLSFCRDFYYSNYTEPALLIRIIDILLPHYKPIHVFRAAISSAGYSCPVHPGYYSTDKVSSCRGG